MIQISNYNKLKSAKTNVSAFKGCVSFQGMVRISSLVCFSLYTNTLNKKNLDLKKPYYKEQMSLKKKKGIQEIQGKGYVSFRRRTKIINKRKIKARLAKLYCSSTKNNTILTLTDTKGNTKGWGCSGGLGFKNARKSTTYAAQAAAESMIKKAKVLGYTHLRLSVKGLGRGKQSCLRALSKSGLKIVTLEDNTSLPHNGCRPPKKRRT